MIRSCRFCGDEFVTRCGNNFFCSKECKKKYDAQKRENAKQYITHEQEVYQQLCWKCAKCYGDCPWSDLSFTPIKGWKATHTVKMDSSGNTYDAYTVIECPEFVPDRRFYE